MGAGNIVELSGRAPGKLSTVARLIARAQAVGEPVAWVSERGNSNFYPPDFMRVGVDLASLVVVRVPGRGEGRTAQAGDGARGQAGQPAPASARTEPASPVRGEPAKYTGAHAVVRATEILLRSGAFGLVVVDLSHEVPKGELSWQSRLSGLVRMHEARLVLLTSSKAEEPSLGPLVALRVTPEVRMPERDARVHVARVEGAFALRTTVSGRAVLAQHIVKAKLGQEAEASPDVRALPEGLA
jgi:recombination protein RecA